MVCICPEDHYSSNTLKDKNGDTTTIPTTTPSFSFTLIAATCTFNFSFANPISIPIRTVKRRRALCDVDGSDVRRSGEKGRKKRRLRLHLITSRLSRPFSQPATNINSRGVSKIAVWGKSRALGRSVLRKAAIMNRIRLSMDRAQEGLRREREREAGTFALSEIVGQKQRILPLPPSPLGLSAYDALDLEDFEENGSNEGLDGVDKCSAIYSDFNIMNPASGDGDSLDFLDALNTIDGILSKDLSDAPPSPPADGVVEMLKEQERQGQSFFVKVGPS